MCALQDVRATGFTYTLHSNCIHMNLEIPTVCTQCTATIADSEISMNFSMSGSLSVDGRCDASVAAIPIGTQNGASGPKRQSFPDLAYATLHLRSTSGPSHMLLLGIP